jgi:arrestin-related trafficking adapter 3/6
MVVRPALETQLRTMSGVAAPTSFPMNGAMSMADEKPLASGNGINVNISLAEPMLFLQGFEQGDSANRNTAMLRGALTLRISKPAKIKAVTLKFKGQAVTKWPEGMFQTPRDVATKHIS